MILPLTEFVSNLKGDVMLPMVNFGVIVLKAKEPFVVWNNSLEEDGRKFPREEVNENPTAYIIPEMEVPEDLENYLQDTYRDLFRNELYKWWRNEEDWPGNLDYKKFREWFEVQYSPVVFDGHPEKGPTLIKREQL